MWSPDPFQLPSLPRKHSAMQNLFSTNESKSQTPKNSALVRMTDMGPDDKKWAKGIFSQDTAEIAGEATFIWNDDSGSFTLRDLYQKHLDRNLEEGRLINDPIEILVFQIRSAGVGPTAWKANAMPLDWQPQYVQDLITSSAPVAKPMQPEKVAKVDFSKTWRAIARSLEKDPATAKEWECDGVLLHGKQAHMARELQSAYGFKSKRKLIDVLVREHLADAEEGILQATEAERSSYPF